MENKKFRIFLNEVTFTKDFEHYLMTDLNKKVISEFKVYTIQTVLQKNIIIEANTRTNSEIALKKLVENAIELSIDEIGDKRLTDYFEYIFQNTLEEKLKYSHLSKKAKEIRKFLGISRDLSMLLAMIEDNSLLEKVITDLYTADITGLNEDQINTLKYGSQRAKKKIIKLIIAADSFAALQVQKRGRSYISAITSYFLNFA